MGIGELAEWIANDELNDERKSRAQQAAEASAGLAMSGSLLGR